MGLLFAPLALFQLAWAVIASVVFVYDLVVLSPQRGKFVAMTGATSFLGAIAAMLFEGLRRKGDLMDEFTFGMEVFFGLQVWLLLALAFAAWSWKRFGGGWKAVALRDGLLFAAPLSLVGWFMLGEPLIRLFGIDFEH